VSGSLFGEPDGLADSLSRRVRRPAHIVLGSFVERQIVEIVEKIPGRGTVCFERLQRILLDLGMWIVEGCGCQGSHGGGWVRSETGQFAYSRRGKTTDLGRGHGEEAYQFRQSGRIRATAELHGALDGQVVRLSVHVAVHETEDLTALASGREPAGRSIRATRNVRSAHRVWQ